uniref:Uncharacterized protein n=1 Tax=Pararge aegeria TaxID=116150 RepID=S4NMM8_9NEOP
MLKLLKDYLLTSDSNRYAESTIMGASTRIEIYPIRLLGHSLIELLHHNQTLICWSVPSVETPFGPGP